MVLLCVARICIELVPLRRWSGSLGTKSGPRKKGAASHLLEEGRRAASIVSHAAGRLPFETKCLPRAVALSWTLRRMHIPHSVVIAARPLRLRNSADALHGWVEVEGHAILGDLPGPWLETLRLGAPNGGDIPL